MSSVDLSPGLSPLGLGGVPLEDVQPFESLGRLPVGNPRGEARQVVGSGMRVRRSAQAEFMLHNELSTRGASREVP